MLYYKFSLDFSFLIKINVFECCFVKFTNADSYVTLKNSTLGTI